MKKREEIYKFIVMFVMENQYSPSVREICEGVGLKSTSSVYSHMDRLKKEGRIDYNPTSPRTITIPGYKFMKIEKTEKGDILLPRSEILDRVKRFYEHS